jgi:hypothetical protein
MNAHFFDINSAITMNSQVWLVSKTRPNQPIVKISQSDFNLIKKGVFKNNGELLTISRKDYWISSDLLEKIKIQCKKLNVNITDITFSMQEFMNPEVIKSLDYKIWEDHFLSLKNSNDDIYIICSKNTEKNYESQISKLEDFLLELGLKVKKYYYFSETFYNRDGDKISHRKIRLLLQHAFGLKTDDVKFTDEEINQYDEIFFYDDEKTTIQLCKKSNDILKFLYDNSESSVKEKVKSLIEEKSPSIIISEVTFNKVNPFVKTKVDLVLDRIIKTYERFINKF